MKNKLLSLLCILMICCSFFGFSASASYEAYSSTGLSCLKDVEIIDNELTGTLHTYGWFDNLTLYSGTDTSVGGFAFEVGTWLTDTPFSFDLNDFDKPSTSGYTLVLKNTEGNEIVTLYIPPDGTSSEPFSDPSSDVSSDISSDVESDVESDVDPDIQTSLSNIQDNQQTIITILLFVIGTAAGVLVVYLLYSFLKRFINY